MASYSLNHDAVAWHLGLTDGPHGETKAHQAFGHDDFLRVHRTAHDLLQLLDRTSG